MVGVVVVVGEGGKKGGGSEDGGGKVLYLFNLFLMAKSTAGGPGAFFTRSLAVFCLCQILLIKIQQLDSLHQKLIYLRIQVKVDFACSKYSFLLDQVFV